MTSIKAISGLLLAIVATVFAGVVFGAAQASASSAPVVIPYAKTCNELIGHCKGTANGVTIEMQITGFRATGDAAQLTLTEWITVGDISFTAVMNAHRSPAGFIVLNGTVTDGSFAGAQVHQRSNYVRGPANASEWTGELQLMPASA
jgi:hypothetical protein